jgi:hypothetical protein
MSTAHLRKRDVSKEVTRRESIQELGGGRTANSLSPGPDFRATNKASKEHNAAPLGDYGTHDL